MPNYVPGTGNPNARLMIVGEAPGEQEDLEKRAFVDPSGEFLWEIMSNLGIERDEVWTTNVFKYRPPQNNIHRIAEVCNPFEELEKLKEEIYAVKPNCILALGGTAFEALTNQRGILKWRGSILQSKYGFKLVGTIHPSNLLRREAHQWGRKPWPYIWRFIAQSDIQKAVKQSQFLEYDLPQRYVKIAQNSVELMNFLSRNEDKERVACDIESINCVPVCIGLAFNNTEALVIPFFNRLNEINLSGMSKSDQAYCWILLNKMFKEKKIIGQNFKYDQEKLQMIGFTFKEARPVWSDTLIKAHTIMCELPSKRMEMLQSLWTDMPYHKDEGKEFNPKKDKIDKLFHYCGLDALSTWETDTNMDEDLVEMSQEYGTDLVAYYDYKMELHQVYMEMEAIGFNVDKEARKFLKTKYETQHEVIQQRFREALPNFQIEQKLDKKGKPKKRKMCHEGHFINVAAPGQLAELVYGYLKLPLRTRDRKVSTNEDTLVELMNNVVKDESKRAILRDIIEDRRVRKTLGTYVNAKLDFDGRIRGTYRITGTETGRSSTAILKPPLRPSKSGHAFQTLTKHGSIGSDIRSMYAVDEGFVFVQTDLSQAEPRIVAVLSEDWELLSAFNNGKVDIHRRTAGLIWEFTSYLTYNEEFIPKVDDMDKDSPYRFVGKKVRNGGNYNMKKGRLSTEINSDAKRFNIDVSVSEWRAGKMLEKFHEASPKIRGVFHRDVQEAICETRTLVNPYGKVRVFHERLDSEDVFKEGYAEIPQSTVADHVKHAILRIKKEMPDFKRMLMGEAHDALLFRFPVGEYMDRAKVVKKEFEVPIDFSSCTLKRNVQLRIPADMEIGFENYRKLEKLKVG